MPSETIDQLIQLQFCAEPAGVSSLADDVLDGLTRPFKELPPKHLYDARGSELFEQICLLPEYYPTRTEMAILSANLAEIVGRTQATELVELGSGGPLKAGLLLRGLGALDGNVRYVPVDVSGSALEESLRTLGARFPQLRINGLIGDFEQGLAALPSGAGPRLVALLGGTLGNFLPGSRRRLLRQISTVLGENDHLLLGADLVKDPRLIEAAYDDSAGVTAEFNLNMLYVLNRELAADFDPALFEHVAFFDRRHEWIEMRLRAVVAHTVSIAALDLEVDFAAREELRTEISAKFTRTGIARDLSAAGLQIARCYTDARELFAVVLARPVQADPAKEGLRG